MKKLQLGIRRVRSTIRTSVDTGSLKRTQQGNSACNYGTCQGNTAVCGPLTTPQQGAN